MDISKVRENIKVSAPTVRKEATVAVPSFSTLKDMVDRYGEEFVFWLASGRLRTMYINQTRKFLERKVPESELQQKLDEWNPTTTSQRSTLRSAIRARYRKEFGDDSEIV